MKSVITAKTKLIKYLTIIVSVFLMITGTLFMNNVKKATAVSYSAVSPSGEADSLMWTKSGETITATETTDELQFYLATDNNLRDEYNIEATFTSDDGKINKSAKECGIVPFYLDQYNYVVVCLKWASGTNSKGLGSIVVKGLMQDKDLEFHNQSGLSHVIGDRVINMSNSAFKDALPDEGLTLRVEKKVNYSYKCYELDIYLKKTADSDFTMIDTAVLINLTTKYGSGLSKAGLYAYNAEYVIEDVDFETYTYAKNANQTLGEYTVMNGTGNVWAYNEKTDELKLNGHEGTGWGQTFAVKNGNLGTSYYVGTRITPEYSDALNYWTNPSDSAYGTAEFICGIIPYYGDANNRVMVFFSEWTTTRNVNIVVENYLNGAVSGTEFRTKSISQNLFGYEKYLEASIIGDVVSVYVNRSVEPVFTTTITGLQTAMSKVAPKYGAMGVSCSAKYAEIIQSPSRIYTSTEEAKVSLKSFSEISKVNGVCHIDAQASNGTDENCYVSVKCTSPNGKNVEVVNNNYFIPTEEGDYTVTITAYDSFGVKGEVLEVNVQVVSEDTAFYIIRYKAPNCTGRMRDQYALCGESVTLSANGFSLANEKFIGWGVKEYSTKKAFSDKQVIKDGLSSTDGAVVTLYAIFSKDSSSKSEDEKTSGGCSGSADVSFTAISVMALSGVAMFTKKLSKKEQ